MTDTTAGDASGQGGQESSGEASNFLKELQGLKGQMGEMGQELQHHRQNAKRFEKVSRAFSGDEDEGPKGKWVDPIMDMLLEAEKQGKPMPMTAQMAVQMQSLIDAQEAQQQLINELKKELSIARNPQFTVDNQIYASMDTNLNQTLTGIYGENVPQSVINACEESITEKITELQKTDPKTWDRIRRDSGLQRKFVNHVVSTVIPPKARQMMQQEHESKQPVTMSIINAAVAEAQKIPDPTLRRQAMQKVREALWDFKQEQLRKPRR